MEKIQSCCGVICSECKYFPEDCTGCPAEQGKVFWLQFTGGSRCAIYECCINQKKRSHCGGCKELPCAHYEQGDPTLSEEENRRILEAQLENLRNRRGEGE